MRLRINRSQFTPQDGSVTPHAVIPERAAGDGHLTVGSPADRPGNQADLILRTGGEPGVHQL